MKKVLIVIFLLLLVGGGGGAAYYFFFMQEDDTAEVAEDKPIVNPAASTKSDSGPILDLENMPEEKITEFYVIDQRVPVRATPAPDGLIVDYLYKGEKVEELERQGDWIRLTDYLVLVEGSEEQAEWVNIQAISDAEPIIEAQEQMEILDGYLVKSDDYKQYQPIFRKQTKALLDDNTCKPEDFEELGGWVRSVTYKDRNVYFIYCGGLEQEDKIYLDVDKKEIFYR